MTVKVINIGGKVVNNYLLVTEHGCVAIDTGYAGGFDQYSSMLSKNGLSMSDIKFVFLTHAHDDHAGFLGELLSATKAPVILHHEAIGRLMQGQNRFTGGCTSKTALLFCKCLALAGKGKHKFPPIDVSDKAIIVDKDEQPFKDLGIFAKVLLLPGHTADSIGLLLEDGRLFCGDAAMNGFSMIARHPVWLEDLESHRHTWDLMISSGVKMVYSGHGNPFPMQDLRRFRNHMDGKKLYTLKEY